MFTTICCHTVTVYRKGEPPQVAEKCFYRYWDEETEGPEGVRLVRRFRLIAPSPVDIDVGDRIYDGVGPQEVDWDTFLPVNVPGLSQAAWVKPWFVHGKLHHTEAGR